MGTLGAAALILAAVGVYVSTERVRALDEGAVVAARLAQVLDEQTARAFQGVDLILLGMAETIALAPPMVDHDAAFEEALRTRLKHLPFVRSLFVIGADGFITQDSNHSRPPRFGLADRDYFRVHQNDPAMGLHIGPPLVSRSLGRWFISMSRRISGPDGRFAGIAVAAVEPGYFERFYENLHLQAGDSIAMFRRDGTVLFRSPYSETVMGQSFPDHPVIRRLSERSEGSLRMVSVFDGVPRIVSYRAVDGLPLVVTVALAEAAVLSRWWQHATITLAGTTVAVALAATVYLLLARQARQRRALRERLAHARGLEDLGRMTGGMAHDFNNILNVVSTNLESIRRVAVRERIPLSVDPARRAIDQGAKLISQLLAFARRQELTVRAVDPNRLVQALIPMLTQGAGSHVGIFTDLHDDVWPCFTDETQFNSALLNLVVNARHAMPEGEGEILLTTRNHPQGHQPWAPGLVPGDYVRVTVTDNGTGMPPSVMRRATEPLYTTKGEGMGTGLGLSQVYGFARQVGGDLLIESTVGVGTSVHLLFRRAPSSVATGPS